jgi:hypothetical protein
MVLLCHLKKGGAPMLNISSRQGKQRALFLCEPGSCGHFARILF